MDKSTTAMRVRVKICGITNREDALAAAAAGADALGFVFAPSRRQVTPQQAAAIVRELPPFVTTVGVVVNQDVPAILEVCPLDVVQFHGQESPAELARVRGMRRIKALRVQQIAAQMANLEAAIRQEGPVKRDREGTPARIEASIRQLTAAVAAFQGVAEAFLLDAEVAGQEGGTGQTFPWAVAAGLRQAGVPVIVAGGLTPQNVGAAIRQVRPAAVDVSSGVEREPGRKDPEKLRQFMAAVAGASTGNDPIVESLLVGVEEVYQELRAARAAEFAELRASVERLRRRLERSGGNE
jgi:phosphoribosylanthranilate isomerase